MNVHKAVQGNHASWWASASTSIRIGQLTAKSVGLFPSIELRDVALLDPQGREALRLPVVWAALSPTSVLGSGFEQLVIDQPALDVRRTTDGKIYVGGLEVSAKSEGGSGVADWFFSQAEFVIRGGAVRWADELSNTPPLAASTSRNRRIGAVKRRIGVERR